MIPTTLPGGITLSASTVLTLAAGHIGHYAEQVETPRPVTRQEECRYYLELWTSIRTAVNRGQELGSEQTGELYDAVTSGEHDGLLTSDELLAVLGSEEGRRAS